MPHSALLPEQALERLLQGNARYASDQPERPNQSSARRAEVAATQAPFAAIVGCSDSRVPVEVIFDQGVGDLFVVRTAGNLIEDVGLASVEFAVASLGVRLVMVMGHHRCGAVNAAVEAALALENQPDLTSIEPPGKAALVQSLIAKIQPAVDAVRRKEGDLLVNAICANAQAMARRLVTRSLVIHEAVQSRQIKIVSAIYDLDTARVELI